GVSRNNQFKTEDGGAQRRPNRIGYFATDLRLPIFLTRG
ncbi:MAG: hypothetical protein ACI8W7_001081, partial [Gammaproteobacteria bacterium]